ncbi:MAG: cohesin domain-containing protein [Dehalococcoidia bacterium]|jgi:hypothetical protein
MKNIGRYGVQLLGLTILALLVLTACTNSGGTAPTPTPTSVPTATVTATPTAITPPISSVTVSIDGPATVKKSSGRYFHVLIKITPVNNLKIAQYDIIYDPSVIRIQHISPSEGVTAGMINGTRIPIDDWGFVPANTQGTVRIINVVSKDPSVSGEGYLADIYFKVMGDPGDSSVISFIDGTGNPPCYLAVVNDEGKQIPATWINGSVTVE